MIIIVDLNIGNIRSLEKALDYIGAPYMTSKIASDFDKASGIIIPGVGSFSEAVKCLDESGLRNEILKFSLEKRKPILGICVGMQLLATLGSEGGESKGLGLIKATVEKIDNKGQLLIPHMGWNSVKHGNLSLFNKVEELSDFYFVHSYSMRLQENIKVATAPYGDEIIAYVNKENIHGAQFHPEKSQSDGLMFLKNFVSLC